jgi:hypothetical protein
VRIVNGADVFVSAYGPAIRKDGTEGHGRRRPTWEVRWDEDAADDGIPQWVRDLASRALQRYTTMQNAAQVASEQ